MPSSFRDIYTDRDTFRAMLRKKDPAYLKRTVDMIVHWDRTFFDPGIVQIHGDRDHTIPLKNVKTDFVIHGGSHVMILTRAEDVNRIVNEILTGREMNPGRF